MLLPVAWALACPSFSAGFFFFLGLGLAACEFLSLLDPVFAGFLAVLDSSGSSPSTLSTANRDGKITAISREKT
uniref:Putative secreted protein n=1 Tax=Ixodes ricinus TaxID=34613 RepID=A0A6B0U3M9_IXORI